jgi:diadenosine tetraphosphate (Ap4A) HIT family hydrolase
MYLFVQKGYVDLTETECMELWVSVKYIVENFIITLILYILPLQDGEEAGQTVNHLHVHLIPTNKNTNFTEIDADGII